MQRLLNIGELEQDRGGKRSVTGGEQQIRNQSGPVAQARPGTGSTAPKVAARTV